MPGSSNILQFNAPANNQESDATYTTDATRLNGVVVNSPFPSPLANKMFYQWSTMLAAFGAALANKGYVVSDANLATLTSVLQNLLTTADVGPLPFLIGRNGAAINHTGDTTVDTIYNFGNLPIFQTASFFRLKLGLVPTSQVSGTSQLIFTYGGVQVLTQNIFSTDANSYNIFEFIMVNRGSLTSQFLSLGRVAGFASSLEATATVNSGVAQPFLVQFKNANNTDAQRFEFVEAEFIL